MCVRVTHDIEYNMYSTLDVIDKLEICCIAPDVREVLHNAF